MKTLTGFLVLALMATAVGAQEYPMSTIDPASDFAETIQGLYVEIFWWSVGILAVVWVALAWILIRFRERPDSPKPKQIHGHTGLEIAWTVVPALIVVAISIPTIQAVFATQTADADAFVVDVIGNQYWWEYRYPQNGGVVTANELRLPVGRPVSLRIWSDDVIHSFWIPMLGGKRDANPLRAVPEGRNPEYNWIHMTPQQTGDFLGQCAEFCGESHSRMMMNVVVTEEEEFESWLAEWQAGHPMPQLEAPVAEIAAEAEAEVTAAAPAQAEDPEIAAGRILFLQNCSACHAVNNSGAAGDVAPNLTLLAQRRYIAAGMLENTPENLKQWIRDPRSIKPGVLMPGNEYPGGRPPIVWPAFNLTEDQLDAVVAYLTSLR